VSPRNFVCILYALSDACTICSSDDTTAAKEALFFFRSLPALAGLPGPHPWMWNQGLPGELLGTAAHGIAHPLTTHPRVNGRAGRMPRRQAREGSLRRTAWPRQWRRQPHARWRITGQREHGLELRVCSSALCWEVLLFLGGSCLISILLRQDLSSVDEDNFVDMNLYSRLSSSVSCKVGRLFRYGMSAPILL
jgi:hypothetical protein